MTGMPIRRDGERRLALFDEPQIGDEVLEAMLGRIANGSYTFGQICEGLRLPYSKFLSWIQADEARWGMFLKAHEARSMQLVSETIGIADDAELDPADKRIRIDTRFRYAKHHAPGLYGEKEDRGGVTVTVNLKTFDDAPETLVVSSDG